MLIGPSLGIHIEMHHLPTIPGVVLRPIRCSRSVRVAGAREVGPVGLNQIAQFLILGLPDRIRRALIVPKT